MIVVAMPEEAAPFLGMDPAGGQDRPYIKAGATVHRLTICGRSVMLVQSGVGLVNAAIAATVTAEPYLAPETRLAAIISAGTAGGLGVGIRVGDVVVGETYRYTDADTQVFGYALGQIPSMPAAYCADEALMAAARGAGVLSFPDARVHIGPMVSGDSFVAGDIATAVRANFPDALSVDMESTALAQTAYRLGVPFLSVRGISDLVDAGEFADRVTDAATRSATIVAEILRSPAP